MKKSNDNPVVVIGAGPVGIAAAAHLKARGLHPLVLEKGLNAGHAVQKWGHVKVFTPWKYITDKAVLKLLEREKWQHPDLEHLPTGQEIVEEYLIPAASIPELKDAIVYDADVIAISKQNLSRSSSNNRDDAPYTIHYKTSNGDRHIILASAVIDASGTWYNPNPIGADGLPVAGEEENKNSISYGIPDVLQKDKFQYEGKRTLVLGGGHSAINVALDILKLKDLNTNTRLVWGLRRNNLDRLLGGGINDELPARGELGIAAKKAIDLGTLELLAPLKVNNIKKSGTGLLVEISVDGVEKNIEIDRIIVATGFRADLNMLREIRLDIDEIVEAPTALAPLIDPNLHSCGTVRPHGVEELSHHDKNFFIVGMKAYGRAPTFLMLTGYEQVRSIAAELSGDHEAARRVELALPETGVCNSSPQESGSSCCGSSAQTEESDSGCCGSSSQTQESDNSSCSSSPQTQESACCGT